MLSKQITKTIVSIFVLAISTSVFAKGLATVSCADLLAPVVPPAASELDYTLSDFEGLYLELIEDVGAAGQLSSEQLPRFYETFLNKKAEFLNAAIYVVRRLAISKMYKQPMAISVEQLFNMILSLGVDPKMYGFSVDGQGRPEFIVPEPTPQPAQNTAAAQPQPAVEDPSQGFIGFIAIKNQGERDLPDHLKRSIGFGPQGIRRNEPPARKAGRLELLMNMDTKQLVLVDYYAKIKHTVDPQILAVGAAKTDSKNIVLAFDKNSQSWFVSFENIANPEGLIGFAVPGK